jgi:hypothetical protein
MPFTNTPLVFLEAKRLVPRSVVTASLTGTPVDPTCEVSTWYLRIESRVGTGRLFTMAVVIFDSANAALSGAKTVNVPLERAEPSPALVIAAFRVEKSGFELTIEAIFAGPEGSSSLLQERVTTEMVTISNKVREMNVDFIII